MPTVRLSRESFLKAMQSPKVRAALYDKAVRVAAAADAMARAEGVEDFDTEVSQGTRPKGRPYARVAVPLEAEWGSFTKPKRRILGRVAEANNTPRRRT